MVKYIPASRLYANPDCGLKTRDWPEIRSVKILTRFPTNHNSSFGTQTIPKLIGVQAPFIKPDITNEIQICGLVRYSVETSCVREANKKRANKFQINPNKFESRGLTYEGKPPISI